GEAVWNDPEHGGPLKGFIRVSPEHQGVGVETWFAEWGEQLAQERGAQGIRWLVADRDASAHQLLGSRGYVHVRSLFTMRKDLRPGEILGAPPAAVTIRPYGDVDERVLFDIHQGSFARHWGFRPTSFDSFNQELHAEDWDPSLVYLAEVGDQVVGCVISCHYETHGSILILGVLEPWRGRGIATALLNKSFAELGSRSAAEARLAVDAENVQGAVALYERAGMTIDRRYDLFDLGTDASDAARR
ncbi:MAG: N-acetyltransferase, partial [Candidatus Nanopelagicales bacterium]